MLKKNEFCTKMYNKSLRIRTESVLNWKQFQFLRHGCDIDG